jgi:hypothetical protein
MQNQPTRSEPLLAWQWRNYQDAHHDRRNLVLHLATQPVFVAGLLTVALGPLFDRWSLVAAGAAAMVLAFAIQGAGHAREAVRPIPFAGPGDFFARVLAEQLITFPRFVLSGGLARAWRRAAA